MPATAPAQQQAKKIPLRMAARERVDKITTRSFAASADLEPVKIPEVGLASWIMVQFRGNANFGGTGTKAWSDRGPFNLVDRFRVNLNQGAANQFDVSGYGTYLVDQTLDKCFAPDLAGIGSTTPHSDIYAAATADGDNTLNLTWIIPQAKNRGMQFETGVIPLNAPELQVVLEIRTSPASSIGSFGSTGTGITGTFHITYGYYQSPDFRYVQLPPPVMVRWIESEKTITADNSQTVFDVLRQGKLQNIMHLIRVNNVRQNYVDDFELRFNETDTVYQWDRWVLRALNRQWLGVDLPKGAFFLDFDNAYGIKGQSDGRDWIDTQAITTTQTFVRINTGGAGLGGSNNVLHAIRSIVQPVKFG